MYQNWKRPDGLSQEQSASPITSSEHTATYESANRWEGTKSSAHSICQDDVYAGVSKLLSFVFFENQLQKIFREVLSWWSRCFARSGMLSACSRRPRVLKRRGHCQKRWSTVQHGSPETMPERIVHLMVGLEMLQCCLKYSHDWSQLQPYRLRWIGWDVRCIGYLSRPLQCVVTLGPARSFQIPQCCPLHSRIPQRRQSDRTIRAHPWEILVPSLHSSAEKTQQESPKDMILKMRECHNNPTVNGVWTDSVDITMAPTTRPCGQRRARSGRLRSHGHRASCLRSHDATDKQSDNPQGALNKKGYSTQNDSGPPCSEH